MNSGVMFAGVRMSVKERSRELVLNMSETSTSRAHLEQQHPLDSY